MKKTKRTQKTCRQKGFYLSLWKKWAKKWLLIKEKINKQRENCLEKRNLWIAKLHHNAKTRKLYLKKSSRHLSKQASRLSKKTITYYRRRKTWTKKARINIKKWFEDARYTLSKPRVQRLILATSIVFLICGSVFYWYVLRNLPTPSTLTTTSSPLTTIIRDRKGRVLYKVYKDANRIKLSWEEIPQVVKDATIAIEDANFYNHHGIELRAILRAFLHNLKQQNINLYQGGSTITQQLVKNRLLEAKKTYQRKLKEIVLAIWTELQYSKKEILVMYLNEVGYGGPAYGIEAASQMYFGKSAKELDLAQAAFLTGLPAAPTTFSPFGENPELSTQRQIQVLERMSKLGMINENQYQEAKNEKLAFVPQKIDIAAPHFVMFVKDQIVQKLGEAKVSQGGLDVITTLDLDIQKKAEEIVKKQISQIKDRYKIHNAAALVTDPKTGDILAMVGSVDYFDTANKGYVNVTNMPRQPGSSIKPVNYAYAFDHGYLPTNTIEDSPVVYVAKGSTEVYAPKNYDGQFHGTVTLRSALANSYNVPAVKILNSYGVDKMVEQGVNMGIRSWLNTPKAGLSLTLGGAEVTMLDMTRAYQTIANLGVRKELRVIREIHDSQSSDITYLFYQNQGNKNPGQAQAAENSPLYQNGQQVISPVAAYWLTDILSDNVARLPAFGPYAKLTIPNQKVAVKTGTSNEFRDNWTIGFTPDYLTAVWVGNNDGSFMNKRLVSGITGAAPIWNEIMSSLLANEPPKDFPKPSGLVPIKICAVNGLLTCPNCPSEKIEYYTVDKIPKKKCYFKSASDCDEARKQAEGKSDEEKKHMLAGCGN